MLEARGVCKSYGPSLALDEAGVSIAEGEVHALLGANGAGKSTLAKVLAGVVRADAAEIRLGDEHYVADTRTAARSAGVEIVLQELTIFDTLTVAENLFLDELPRGAFGWVDRRSLLERSQRALDRVGLGISPSVTAGQLGVAEKQLVEIAAALERDCRLLILDEPTATLPADAVDRLYRQVRRLRRRGVSVLLITHRLEDVHAVADRVTVLRDGCVAARGVAVEEGLQTLERALGLETPEGPPVTSRRESGASALRVERLTGNGFVDIDLEVAHGQILGLGGLVGSGRTQLLRAIYGADDRRGGRVLLKGSELSAGDVAASVAHGMGFVPEERQSQGLFLDLSIEDNLSASCPAVRAGWLAHLGWIDRQKTRLRCASTAQTVSLVHRDLDQTVRELSGGNQQKVVLARWLLAGASVLLLDEPSRGVDLGARAAVHALLRQRVREGGAVLVASSDSDELLALCDTIGVLVEGRLTELRPASDWSQASLLAAALGRAA
ncbi:MAG: sugar ABC transporter ATP-binding protein [Acidobacteriota bacterium]